MSPRNSIIDVFQQCVKEHGHEVAVDFNGETLTYRQLDDLSTQVAGFLHQKQIAGQPVGVSMARSQYWIVSLLGILKARAIYVPLDMAHPEKRMMEIVNDCQIKYVICHSGPHPLADEVECISIEEILKQPAYEGKQSLPSPDDLAYLLYTSGTTGKPKGVPMRHWQAVLNAQIAVHCVFHAEPGDNIAQLAGINFLVSLVESFTILLNGLKMVMIPDDIKKDPRRLIPYLEEKNVSRASIAPSLLTAFPKTDIPTLKTIVLIGEPVSLPVRDYWMKRLMLVNCYGFTESSLCVSTGVYTKDSLFNDIGEITPCLEAHILDEQLREVKPGATGELCVGGPSLTEGYWNNPQLNAEKFIKNVYSKGRKHQCDILYRTGDKVAQLHGGHLLYKGRTDFQVKIRGMRIETREVEMHIEAYPSIERCIVLAKSYKETKRLVAYVKSVSHTELSELKSFAASRLPEFMCPSLYVFVDEFPLNINQKVDRLRLPEPVWEDNSLSTENEEEWTETEKKLSIILKNLLGTRAESTSSTFLGLGGDSLSMMFLSTEIEKVFGKTIEVSTLAQAKDLKGMAACIEKGKKKEGGKEVGEKESLNKEIMRQFPLPQSLKSIWIDCNISVQRNDSYKLFFVFEFDHQSKPKHIEQAWNLLTQQQDCFRLSFQHDKQDVWGRIMPAQYETLSYTDISDDEMEQMFEQFFAQPLPYDADKLYRIQLFHLPNGRFELCLLIHHLIFDGLSYAIISRQLHHLYHHLNDPQYQGAEVVSYQDYIEWKTSQEVHSRKECAFWKNYLEKAEPLRIPKHQNGQEIHSAFYEINLSEEAFRNINAFCKKESFSPFVVLLAGYGVTICNFLTSSSFAISTAVTDREQTRYLNTGGYMISVLPVMMNIGNGITARALIKKLAKDIDTIKQHIMPINEISYLCHRQSELLLTDFSFNMQDIMPTYTIPWKVESPSALALYVYRNQQQITIQFHYQKKWFAQQVIESMAKTMDAVYINMLSKPEQPLDKCSLISAHDQSILTDGFMLADKASPMDNVVTVIEKIVATTPDKTAYRYKGQDTSYREFSDMADRIADFIEQELTDTQDIAGHGIGVSLSDKSLLMPTIMAIFKLGMYYVPIDISLPQQRQDFILSESKCLFVVTDSIPMGEKKKGEKGRRSKVTIAGNHTAYVIFTSGSTGMPKGTPISHSSLMTFCRNACHVTGIDSHSRMLQYANTGFDASIYELFPVLTVGGTLVFPTEEDKHDLSRLMDFIEQERISEAVIPPSLMSVLPYREIPTLKTIVLGGETTPKPVQQLWGRTYRLINGYGPTENTVMSTFQYISDEFPANNIGKALEGVSTYVLDNQMRLLPNYVIGQLYLGGKQLSAGYMNRQDINAQRFIKNPYATEEETRNGLNQTIYATGDLVARTSEGELLFLGRIDSQVKVRGYRIEVEEIAHAIERITNVQQVFVTTTDNNKNIVAYYTEKTREAVTPEYIKSVLQQQLPAYMIPAYIVRLDEFPLTDNKKIDKDKLPQPGREPGSSLSGQAAMPSAERAGRSTGLETIMKATVCKLLAIDDISLTSDLFAEGMNSIQAMQLAYELKQQGFSIGFSEIYATRTIRGIAASPQMQPCKWYNHYDAEKPVVILVCGYTPAYPFYEDFIKELSAQYSVLVFDSFAFWNHPSKFLASDYIDYLITNTEKEIQQNNTKIYAVTGHSIGSELGMLLAEHIRQKHNPDVRMVAIGTSLYTTSKLFKYISDDHLVLKQMQKTMPPLLFAGNLSIVMESQPSSSLILNGSVNPEYVKFSETFLKKNKESWDAKYPYAHRVFLHTDHFGLLQPTFLNDILALFT